MPLVVMQGGWEAVGAKFTSFDIWDRNCPNDFSLMSKKEVVKTEKGLQAGPLRITTAVDTRQHLNRTKIVGFVNSGYAPMMV